MSKVPIKMLLRAEEASSCVRTLEGSVMQRAKPISATKRHRLTRPSSVRPVAVHLCQNKA